ncbi:hypothetical protein, partial [Lysinibacillus sp. D4A3_S15]|uniref:hypothetical protein n=1 Tax=Lysinibacillus sp. D4A3_S15 TaxID=2941227 RepID=UPI0020BEE349
LVTALAQLFQRHFYMGITRPVGVAKANEKELVGWCEGQTIPLVAVQCCYFLRPDDHNAYEVARAIDTG